MRRPREDSGDDMSGAHIAMYWRKEDNNNVRCELCPHRCFITDKSAGICGWRENRGGSLTAAGYGRVSSIALDPIEKKPLGMFHPGKNILSVGGFGCNLNCPFCQNHEISMRRDPRGTDGGYPAPHSGRLTPEEVVELAVRTIEDGNIGVAYTYNEPLTGYEFVYDCAALVRDAGLLNVVVTNGYINKEPLEKLLPLIDAMNIDLKAFTEGFYRNVGGSLNVVKETIAVSVKSCHVEVTTLMIPGENEDDAEELSAWLASVDPDIPLHLTRFFPRYRYGDRAPTPLDTMRRSRDAAKKNLKRVFTGNI